MKKQFSHWVLIILIILFFAIPLGSLAMSDPVSSWPKSSYSLLLSALWK